MAKRREQVGKFRKLSFLTIILEPVIGFLSSMAQMIADDLGNRMIYELSESDGI